MAKQTITKLIDDMDDTDADETVRFALDGVQYEIDLSSKNAAKFRQVLQPYVDAGKRMRGATAPARRRGGAPAITDRAQNKAIREWARSKRKKISDRGRIPEEIVAEYHSNAGR
jgi:hypothetical protein